MGRKQRVVFSTVTCLTVRSWWPQITVDSHQGWTGSLQWKMDLYCDGWKLMCRIEAFRQLGQNWNQFLGQHSVLNWKRKITLKKAVEMWTSHQSTIAMQSKFWTLFVASGKERERVGWYVTKSWPKPSGVSCVCVCVWERERKSACVGGGSKTHNNGLCLNSVCKWVNLVCCWIWKTTLMQKYGSCFVKISNPSKSTGDKRRSNGRATPKSSFSQRLRAKMKWNVFIDIPKTTAFRLKSISLRGGSAFPGI